MGRCLRLREVIVSDIIELKITAVVPNLNCNALDRYKEQVHFFL